MFWTFWLLVLFTSHSTDSYKRNKNKIGLASETRPYLAGFKKEKILSLTINEVQTLVL